MSTTVYSQMSTDKLIQRFIDEANHIGGPLSPRSLKVPVRSAEFTHGKDALHAIGAELRARKPVVDLRARLFENESPDVRSWAGTLLHAVDPEWADATVAGLFHKLSTKKVLAWRRRILQKPSRKANLQDITLTQLVECFVDACKRCYGTTRFLTDNEGGGTNMEAYNKAFGDVYAAARELDRRGELRALLPLLDHPLITVRQKAATYGLAVAPNRSVPVLEAVEATKTWPEFIFASTTLDRWRKGTYRAFPDEPTPRT